MRMPSALSITVVSAICGLPSCVEKPHFIGDCWTIPELKNAQRFQGDVYIMVSEDLPAFMIARGCDGVGVVAEIPEGSLKYPEKEEKLDTPTYFKAQVAGYVSGSYNGSIKVNLTMVKNPQRGSPPWMKAPPKG